MESARVFQEALRGGNPEEVDWAGRRHIEGLAPHLVDVPRLPGPKWVWVLGGGAAIVVGAFAQQPALSVAGYALAGGPQLFHQVRQVVAVETLRSLARKVFQPNTSLPR